MRLPLLLACVLCVACSRKRPTEQEQPAPSSSVISLAFELGTCPDVPVCERECDAGSADRCRRLAASYAFGKGVAKDETHATALYEHACEMNDPSACVFAGQMYEFARGVAKNDATAARFYERACGYRLRGAAPAAWAPGCFNLAIMYERGTGVPLDHRKAGELYQLACDGGAKPACDKAKQMLTSPMLATDGGQPGDGG